MALMRRIGHWSREMGECLVFAVSIVIMRVFRLEL
jgi:hypothetical protein